MQDPPAGTAMSPASTNKNIPKLFDPLLIRGLELHNRNLVSSACNLSWRCFPAMYARRNATFFLFFASVVLENLENDPSWYVEIKIKHLGISNSGFENSLKSCKTYLGQVHTVGTYIDRIMFAARASLD